MGSHSLLQEIFLTQGLNSCLLHSTQILYHLSHQGKPLGRKEYLPSSNRQTAPTSYSEPWGSSGREKTAEPPGPEELIKGMISGHPDSCIFPYRNEPNSLTCDVWFSYKQTFDIQTTCPLLQNYITWLSTRLLLGAVLLGLLEMGSSPDASWA